MNVVLNQVHDSETSVFKNQSVFEVDVLPENFLFRDNQLQNIFNNIQPALNEHTPIHTILIGDFATGKTTAIKKIFKTIENIDNKVVGVHINCRLHNRTFFKSF